MRSLDTLPELQRDDRHEARRLTRAWSKVGVIDQESFLSRGFMGKVPGSEDN